MTAQNPFARWASNREMRNAVRYLRSVGVTVEVPAAAKMSKLGTLLSVLFTRPGSEAVATGSMVGVVAAIMGGVGMGVLLPSMGVPDSAGLVVVVTAMGTAGPLAGLVSSALTEEQDRAKAEKNGYWEKADGDFLLPLSVAAQSRFNAIARGETTERPWDVVDDIVNQWAELPAVAQPGTRLEGPVVEDGELSETLPEVPNMTLDELLSGQ